MERSRNSFLGFWVATHVKVEDLGETHKNVFLGSGKVLDFLGFNIHFHVCIKNITIFEFGTLVWVTGSPRLPKAPKPKTQKIAPQKIVLGTYPCLSFGNAPMLSACLVSFSRKFLRVRCLRMRTTSGCISREGIKKRKKRKGVIPLHAPLTIDSIDWMRGVVAMCVFRFFQYRRV